MIIEALFSFLMNLLSPPDALVSDSWLTSYAVRKNFTGISFRQASRPMRVDSIVFPVPVPTYIIKNIISGKIDALKNEDKVREELWKVLIEAQSGFKLSN